MICHNCDIDFIPSKNDKRIKFCSDKCRVEFRNKTNYMKKYYSENIDKWETQRNSADYKDKKNSARRKKYKENLEYREKVKQQAKKYNKENPESKLRQHLSEFGITIDDYNEMLKKQDYKCAICGSHGNDRYKHRKLFVDHNHLTGKVRGLLCERCNFMLGQSKDNVETLRKAIRYLEENNK